MPVVISGNLGFRCQIICKIIEQYFIAIVHHLDGARRLLVLNEYLQDAYGGITTFESNEEVVDSLDKEVMELYDSCLLKQSLFDTSSSELTNHVENYGDLQVIEVDLEQYKSHL